MRNELMRRTYCTEGKCKIVSEWTVPKMLKIAKEEERRRRKKEKQKLTRTQDDNSDNMGKP